MSYKVKPQLKIFKFENNSFKQLAIIDDYLECSWERDLYEAGQFSVTINFNIPNSQYFQKGLFIQFGNDPYDFGEITKINDVIDQNGKGGQLKNITGYDVRCILRKRIIKNLNKNGNWELTSKAEYCLRKLIQDQCGVSCFEEKRKLPIKNIIKMNDSWTSRTNPISSNLNSIAYSEELNMFVAVGASGTILTSTDGINWISRTSGVSTNLWDVYYSSEKNLFISVGNSGTILTSPDGITWISRTSGVSTNLYGCCYSSKLNLFVAVGSKAVTSPDGTTWTDRGTISGTYYDVIYSEEKELFVAVGANGVISSSIDGENWTARTSGVSVQLRRVNYSSEKNLFISVGNSGTILTSPDGITWTKQIINTNLYFNGIRYSESLGLFVAVGNRVITSPDAINWNLGSTMNNNEIVYSKSLGLFVAVGSGGTIYTSSDSEATSNIGNECTVSESFSNLYEVCKTIATQNEIGWRLNFDGKELSLECYAGTDRSNSVQFSPSFDSLKNGDFTDSLENFFNAVYVGGKGENDSRDIYEGESLIDEQSPAGLDRCESWDNQSQLTTEEEYENEANSILTQYAQTLTMSGAGLASCPYIYKEQYNVGDKIKFSFSGKTANVQILSVTEHWGWNNYDLNFSFGKPQNTLADQLHIILRQIQKASSKTNSTDSVRWYEIPNDSEMPASDVTYKTIGFIGDFGTGTTFKLYLDNEKTGSKVYHVYFKQTTGSGKLTLTTGVDGAENLEMNSGTYVAIIYVDENGNVKNQVIDSLATGNYQPITSNAVASEVNTINNNVSTLSSDVVNTNSNVKFIPSVSADESGVFNVTIPGLEVEKIVTGTTISIYFTSSIYKTSATTFSLNVNGKQGNIYDGNVLWRGCPIRTSATSSTVQRYYYIYQYQCLNFRWDGSNWVVVNTSPYIKYRYIQSLNSTAVTITSYNFGNWYYVNALSDGSFEQISHFYKFSASGNFLVATKIIPSAWYTYTAHSTALPLTSAGTNTSADYNYDSAQAPTSDDTMSNVTTQGFKQIRYLKSRGSDVAETTNGRKVHITGTWY